MRRRQHETLARGPKLRLGIDGKASAQIESLCGRIIERDPQSIVILAGDHGAMSYRSQRGFRAVMREDGIPPEQLVRDIYDVLLAIRWGEGIEAQSYPFRSLANVMRLVFYRLGGGEPLLRTAAPDASYLVEEGVLYQVAVDGHPLPEWKAVPGRRGQGPSLPRSTR